jgi:major membrane immunogen (membrane-anchored lipoprotein)
VDKSSNRQLDLRYCTDYFSGNSEYLKQCHNDLRGMKIYTRAFAKAKNLKKVHAIAGATWSYNIFKASVGKALAKAE